MNPAAIEDCGEAAFLVVFGTRIDAALNARVHAAARRIVGLRGVAGVVPAYASLLVLLDPPDTNGDAVAARTAVAAAIAARLADVEDSTSEQSRIVDIAVRYDGPDLAELAAALGLDVASVVALHTAPEYRVAMLGFAPGFPYLLGLDPRLHAPRRANPRTQVPAGSVAIGGAQTGIYPRALPGGWQLIGRTGQSLFDLERDPPALLAPGDRVRFRAVAADAPAPAPKPAPTRTKPAARVEVEAPGLATTLQDLGRTGYAALGVGSAGAMDPVALRLANALVGNPPGTVALECTLRGPDLRFTVPARIALTGAPFQASVDGTPLPAWRPVVVPAGAHLRIGAPRRGAYGYLAVAGGFDVAPVLGSRSVDLNAGLGPLAGRALAAGDWLGLNEACADAPGAPAWSLSPQHWFDADPQRPLRLVPGADLARLDAASRVALETGTFRVAAQSNRVGYRLDGPPLTLAAAHEAISSGVPIGTVQLPPGGQAIVLLAEHPTTGGYPRIAHVAAVDLPRLAQRRPGDALRFELITAAAALTLWQRQRRELDVLLSDIERRA